MTQPILQLIEICKHYSGVNALNRARLSLYAGQVVALLGENGAGKSTLMGILSGSVKPDSGQIIFHEKELSFQHPKAAQDKGISIIHQELNLIPELSIADNIYLGREPTQYGYIVKKILYEKTQKLLSQLHIRHSPDTKVSQLRLGEQQMVEIAKALSQQASIVIMDEPTDALTHKETQHLFDVIKQLKEQGCAIVYISHRLPEIFQICDQVTILRDGQSITQKPITELTENNMIELMVGRTLDQQYPKKSPPSNTVKLKIEQLSGPSLNGIKITNQNFHVNAGEILGFSGLIGSGRTELMKLIYGALPRDSGKISIDGTVINPTSPNKSLQAGLAYISEDRKNDGLILSLSVKENMSLSALRRLCYVTGHIKHATEHASIQHYIHQFNIKTPNITQAVGHLSGGNQQKVAIAKGLMLQPKVLILDEPTRGVDVGAKKEIYTLINTLKSNGLSIILVSSDLPEILGMSDRILVMNQGRINGEFIPSQTNQEQLLTAAIDEKTI
ncbi:ATP-binding cassette domain-containing protein [uncultured Shewanella sp.]|uniref:ATP-binding cassette domain-containing protein n=1 Tax=uncultured Shewanella sp. TaxID=173975 RepID=UPI002606D97E|nr:ATP-binding cassette domain-containing protein [uncultured Shewanella sp.]